MSGVPLGQLLREISSVNPRARGAIPGPEALVEGAHHDSRRMRPGYAFVCVSGEHRDGHEFAADAVRAGASVVFGERPEIAGVEPYVRVEDARRALALLCCALLRHPSRALVLTAVTGTNGKTTITWMLDAVLRNCGLPSAVMGTLGSGSPDAAGPAAWRSAAFTTPEAPELQEELARWREVGVKAGACEVSSHALALRRAYGTRFACSVFTNLTPDHLDFHRTMEEYGRAKSRLFRREERGPEEPPALAVINDDDPAASEMVRGSSDRVIRFGSTPAADVWPEDLRTTPAGIRLRIRYREEARLRPPLRALERSRPDQPESAGACEVESPLLGTFQAGNLLAAFGAGFALGLEPEAVAEGLARLRGVPGRMERVDGGGSGPVVVDYAHTPDALARACASLRPFTPGRLLLVFGCGGDRDRGKRPLMGEAAARGADLIFLTDDNPRSEDPASIRAQARGPLEALGAHYVEEGDRRAAIRSALEASIPGDTVLIAGKGHETVQVRGDRSVPFDDRATARSILRELGR